MFATSCRTTLIRLSIACTGLIGLWGCSAASTPDGTAKRFYELVNANKVDEAIALFSVKDVPAQEMTTARGKFTAVVGQMQSMMAANDGLDEVLVKDVETKTEDTAIVSLTLKFKNGKTKNERLPLVRENGTWLLTMKKR